MQAFSAFCITSDQLSVCLSTVNLKRKFTFGDVWNFDDVTCSFAVQYAMFGKIVCLIVCKKSKRRCQNNLNHYWYGKLKTFNLLEYSHVIIFLNKTLIVAFETTNFVWGLRQLRHLT